MLRQVLLPVTLFCLAASSGMLRAADEKAPDLFRDVLPLLKNKCVQCHGPAKIEAGLNLASPQGLKRGGESGAAVVAHNLDNSLLWKRVAADEMPVDGPLSADEKLVLRRWIEAGAPQLPEQVAATPEGDEHWAFQRLATVTPPPVREPNLIRTPVDQFIEAQLEEAGLTLNPEAAAETLIRRVSFDLTGLPPTVAEVDALLQDTQPGAYERMVDRYLASERYGERWGKYWLDAAGYADSNGYFGADTDRPLAYRYRDYVIRSIQADKPWDQFLREQLAGDELAGYVPGGDIRPEMIDLLEAVHFLRNSPDGTDNSDGNPDELRADKYAVLEGTVQIFGSTMFGMTVQCARCHDHKFEPFSQKDYYQLQAVIYPAFNVDEWIKPKGREVVTATAAEIAAFEAKTKEIDAQIVSEKEALLAWAREHREAGEVVFLDPFDGAPDLSANWSNTVPGDSSPAGQPPIQLNTTSSPAAQAADGTLRILESGSAGDRALSTRKVFDWTPDAEGAWVQATFDLVGGGATAPYVGFLIALKDFNDTDPLATGGNILFDGNAAGAAALYLDYPGVDSKSPGKVGRSGYVPGHNYGIRVTNVSPDKYEVAQVVDGLPEEATVTLTAKDLPDGAFGFEYCCGRSFVVDNVLIERRAPDATLTAEQAERAKLHDQRRQEMQTRIQALEQQRPAPLSKLALVSDYSAKPPEVHLLTRGVYKTPGEVVPPGGPHALAETSNPGEFLAAQEGLPTTGRRRAFAEWVTRPDSRAAATFARVTVNRWWSHHFGTGLVATPDNLGYSGDAPSHRELLDYLAQQFVDGGWKAREFHRLVLCSAVYRQSSVPSPAALQADEANRLVSRYPLRRLDAESIRDAMLTVSGERDDTMYGPYIPTTRSDEGEVIVPEASAGAKRRSIYLYQKRTQILGLLDAFDAPSIVANCTARNSTTVPLQALKLLNSDFVRQRATALATRLMSGNESDDARITLGFRLTAGRAPSAVELAASREFLAQQPAEYGGQPEAARLAWIDFCQMLLSSNAFLYVE